MKIGMGNFRVTCLWLWTSHGVSSAFGFRVPTRPNRVGGLPAVGGGGSCLSPALRGFALDGFNPNVEVTVFIRRSRP